MTGKGDIRFVSGLLVVLDGLFNPGVDSIDTTAQPPGVKPSFRIRKLSGHNLNPSCRRQLSCIYASRTAEIIDYVALPAVRLNHYSLGCYLYLVAHLGSCTSCPIQHVRLSHYVNL
jgi:hypothetical protein